jgi:hypothetical protein
MGFQKDVEELQHQLADELIVATPETWKTVSLHVERRKEGLLCELAGPDDAGEDVTKGMVDVLMSMLRLYRENGKEPWLEMRLSLAEEAPDDWKLSVEYKFAP